MRVEPNALTALATVVVPAFVTDGASLGQRSVYLAPVPHTTTRWRLLARALIIQGTSAALLFNGFPWVLFIPVLACVALLSVVASARGLSYVVMGCGIRDARTLFPDAHEIQAAT